MKCKYHWDKRMKRRGEYAEVDLDVISFKGIHLTSIKFYDNFLNFLPLPFFSAQKSELVNEVECYMNILVQKICSVIEILVDIKIFTKHLFCTDPPLYCLLKQFYHHLIIKRATVLALTEKLKIKFKVTCTGTQ